MSRTTAMSFMFCILILAVAAIGNAATESTPEDRPSTLQAQSDGTGDSRPDSAFSFACYLLEAGHFEQAATEFERFCFLFPENQAVPLAMLRVGICYELAQRYPDAIKAYQSLAERFPDEPAGEETLYRIGVAYYKAGKFEEARVALVGIVDKRPSSPWYWNARYRTAWASLHLHAFAVAEEEFQDLSSRDNPYREAAREIVLTLEKVKDLPYRSPALAGSLSALLPGAGQLYAGEWKDALLSFLVNGALIAGAYEAFDNEVYAVGGVVAAVGLGFYAGNIYGAVNTAHHFNEDGLTTRITALEKQYEWAGERQERDACRDPSLASPPLSP